MPPLRAIDAFPPCPRIAIIGTGFSGAAAATALLRAMRAPFSLFLIDETAADGGGLAYGRARTGEMLNVRARDLGLLADERGDFAAWLEKRLTGRRELPIDIGQIFAPRLLFRDYIRDRLENESAARADVPIETICERAVRIEERDGGFIIHFDGGKPIECDVAILATGYGGGKRKFRYGTDAFAHIPEDSAIGARHVAIVGAGLTMVDVLRRLRRLGCSAPITIISRRGLTPLSQLPVSPFPELWEAPSPPSAAALVREVRRACRRAQERGVPWQAVVNGLRPEVSRIWRSMSDADQRRLLVHARAFWDIHRHRLPADVHDQLRRELSHPRTRVRAGHVLGVREGDPSSVLVRWRGATRAEELKADLVFDCSGHRPALDAPIIASLLSTGLARLDRHGLGLEVEPDGRLVSPLRDGRARLFAIGPLGTGSLMEITAAPEIAEQAGAMAARIEADFRKRRRALADCEGGSLKGRNGRNETFRRASA